MAAQQTAYALELTHTGYVGQIADTRDVRVDGFRNDLAASAEAAFGLGFCRSAATDLQGFGLCNTSRRFLGVLVHSMDFEKTTTGLPSLDFGNLMSRGTVWVRVVEAVTQESTVKVFIADYSGTLANAVAGAFGDTAVAANTATLPNARYLGSAAAGELVQLELNAPGPILLTADA